MIPDVDDFVEIVAENHPCRGLVGKVVSIKSENEIVVEIYGKKITVSPSDLKLKAKVGSRQYSILNRKSIHWNLDGLDKVGLYGLLDIALMLKDYEWCKELYERLKNAPDVIHPSRQYRRK